MKHTYTEWPLIVVMIILEAGLLKIYCLQI